jgi:hypothetical protein
LRDAVAAGIEAEVALVDAGHGTDTDFRDGITEIGLPLADSIGRRNIVDRRLRWREGDARIEPYGTSCVHLVGLE